MIYLILLCFLLFFLITKHYKAINRNLKALLEVTLPCDLVIWFAVYQQKTKWSPFTIRAVWTILGQCFVDMVPLSMVLVDVFWRQSVCKKKWCTAKQRRDAWQVPILKLNVGGANSSVPERTPQLWTARNRTNSWRCVPDQSTWRPRVWKNDLFLTCRVFTVDMLAGRPCSMPWKRLLITGWVWLVVQQPPSSLQLPTAPALCGAMARDGKVWQMDHLGESWGNLRQEVPGSLLSFCILHPGSRSKHGHFRVCFSCTCLKLTSDADFHSGDLSRILMQWI
jgi:hypothetical protein